MKKENIITLVATISFLLLTIIYATYAVLTPTITTNNLNIDTNTSTPLAFTASGGNNLQMNVTFDQMGQTNSGNIVAIANDNLVITLETDGAKPLCCNYNIVWEWDSTDVTLNQYHLSTGASNEFVIIGTLGESYLYESQMVSTVIQGNPKFTVQLPNYNSLSLTNTVYSSQICNNTVRLTTEEQQTWNLTTNFYNLNLPQDNFKGASFSGKAKIAGVSCSAAL